MDDDVIDVTNISEDERRQHMRALDEKTTYPCFYCDVICDRVSSRSACTKYQDWMDYQYPVRRKQGK